MYDTPILAIECTTSMKKKTFDTILDKFISEKKKNAELNPKEVKKGAGGKAKGKKAAPPKTKSKAPANDKADEDLDSQKIDLEFEENTKILKDDDPTALPLKSPKFYPEVYFL